MANSGWADFWKQVDAAAAKGQAEFRALHAALQQLGAFKLRRDGSVHPDALKVNAHGCWEAVIHVAGKPRTITGRTPETILAQARRLLPVAQVIHGLRGSLPS